VLLAAAATGCAAIGLRGWREPAPERRVRNVIVMISDGCGFRHVEAADLHCYGQRGRAVYEGFPCRLAMKTDALVRTAEGLAPGGYDPEAAWSDFGHLRKGATDSAAAATAMSTGRKTLSGAIGVGPDGAPLRHLLTACEQRGMATGVVTTVQLSHATPAGFVAHNEARGNYEQIAREMILDSPVDCIIGCGHPWHDNDGRRLDEPAGFAYVGGRALWRELSEGEAGAWRPGRDDANGNGRPDPGEWTDADHNGRADDAWTMIGSRAEFQALARGRAPKRLIGVPWAATTLQQKRSGDRQAAADVVPLNESVPTLAEMTRAAMNVLDDDPDGLFVMIEGGAVDWTGHDNQAGRMIEEQRDFNDAVEAAVRWVEENSDWDETVLIVTADHECGYLTAGPEVPAYQPLRNNGAGRMPEMAWNSGDHTNSLVPFYARGPLRVAFEAEVIATDPYFGPYLDNTAMASVLFAAVGSAAPAAN
jgi:alkaline phosphatase